ARRRLRGGRRLARGAAHPARLTVLDPLRKGDHGRGARLRSGELPRRGRRHGGSPGARRGGGRRGRGLPLPRRVCARRDGTNGRVPGKDPQGRSYSSFASFSDPDGNGWILQEVTTRLPGRGFGLDVSTLGDLLREAEKHHGDYEATAPKRLAEILRG